eukprot:TRINITY_DN15388_c0_g1_i1.p1 TRINITY_DN15388_c0_g1~~TRINITY_DN15388_c0_g1_i1.p1  ORF type:complete len:195 (+),score=32.90 TRINITY_DN15388_c0_g1_i1:40-624(+)
MMVGGDVLIKAATQYNETIAPMMGYLVSIATDYFRDDTNRDLGICIAIGLVIVTMMAAFIKRMRSKESDNQVTDTHNILKFCQLCGDEGVYREDEYLNSTFVHPFNECFPPVYLGAKEKLHPQHAKPHEPPSSRYEYSRDKRRWVCRKCGTVDRKEDRIIQHCSECPKPLPREYYPERGWWPQFIIPECVGHSS